VAKRGRPKKSDSKKNHAQKQDDYTGNDVATRFQPGNSFWKKRSSHGRNPIFDDPEKLRSACFEYFQWIEENPILEEKIFHFQGRITRTHSNKMHMMTISGLCLFLDISDETWSNYRRNPDFVGIVTEAERIIANQKLSGSAADMLNANIVCREMGLRDRQEHSGDLLVKVTKFSESDDAGDSVSE